MCVQLLSFGLGLGDVPPSDKARVMPAKKLLFLESCVNIGICGGKVGNVDGRMVNGTE